jgi:predicted amidophosphoribosyltransferase
VPTVRELSAPYENFMLGPRPGPGVCDRCFNLTDGFDRCYACANCEGALDAVAPISYSVAHEQLHHALAAYKRLSGEVARRLCLQLGAVLWRYLAMHERCLAAAASAKFALVTTVPSGDPAREESHPLAWIVGEVVEPTRARYEPLLRRSDAAVVLRAFDPAKFRPLRSLDGESVLLVDDTWTTGASAQSAAAALKTAGAGTVAVVVIGRHVNRDWRENDRRLKALPTPFDWSVCALCAGRSVLSEAASLRYRGADAVAPRLAVAEQHDLGIDRLDRGE